MTDGLTLLNAHLNGETLTDEQAAALSEWICAAPEHAALAAELMHLDATLADRVASRSASPLIESADDPDWNTMLTELARQEQSAHPEPINLEPNAETTDYENTAAQPPMTAREIAQASTYLIGQTARKHAGPIAAVAAVLALVVTLVVTLSTNPTNTPNNTPTASTPMPRGSDTNPVAIQPVATITATHNAVWSASQPAGDLRRGTQLTVGQRLTLTQGFAEITTARGAVAILEAPATIELIDSPNALRLHSGKLVGICETSSSKGFLVRTPHMDITDLGTEFGVEVRDANTTEVHVFTGQVRAYHTDAVSDDELQGMTLDAGRAARVDRRSTKMQLGFSNPDAFARSVDPEAATRPTIYSRFVDSEVSTLSPDKIDDGRGWDGPWQTLNSRGSLAMQTLTQDPVSWGASRYMQFQFKSSDTQGCNAAAYRRYGAAGEIDLTKPHVIRFSYRLDTDFDGQSDVENNKIAVFDGAENRFASSSDHNTWSLHAWPNAPEGARPGTWTAYDGDGSVAEQDGGKLDVARLIATSIRIVPGDTYHFQITVFPEQAQWDLVIRHGLERYDSRQALGRPMRFRNAQPKVYGNIYFNAIIPERLSRSISIDDIVIEALPESVSFNALSQANISRERIPVD